MRELIKYLTAEKYSRGINITLFGICFYFLCFLYSLKLPIEQEGEFLTGNFVELSPIYKNGRDFKGYRLKVSNMDGDKTVKIDRYKLSIIQLNKITSKEVIKIYYKKNCFDYCMGTVLSISSDEDIVLYHELRDFYNKKSNELRTFGGYGGLVIVIFGFILFFYDVKKKKGDGFI